MMDHDELDYYADVVGFLRNLFTGPETLAQYLEGNANRRVHLACRVQHCYKQRTPAAQVALDWYAATQEPRNRKSPDPITAARAARERAWKAARLLPV